MDPAGARRKTLTRIDEVLGRMPGWVPPLLAGTLCVLILLGPALLAPHRLLVGSPVSEAPPHAWGLEVAAAGLWEHGPFVRAADAGYPLGFRDHLMDPIHREQHRIRGSFHGTSWTHNELPAVDSTQQDNVTHGHALVSGKTLNAFRDHITILEPYDKDPAHLSFTRLHE